LQGGDLRRRAKGGGCQEKAEGRMKNAESG
jgi:hypothetical protein